MVRIELSFGLLYQLPWGSALAASLHGVLLVYRQDIRCDGVTLHASLPIILHSLTSVLSWSLHSFLAWQRPCLLQCLLSMLTPSLISINKGALRYRLTVAAER